MEPDNPQLPWTRSASQRVAQSLAVTPDLAARVRRRRFLRFLAIGAACPRQLIGATRISGAIVTIRLFCVCRDVVVVPLPGPTGSKQRTLHGYQETTQ